MSLQLLLLLPLPVLLSGGRRESASVTSYHQQVSPKPGWKDTVILPELHQVVAASGDEALDVVWFLARRLVDQAAGNNGRTPTHRVTADLQETTTAFTHTHTHLRPDPHTPEASTHGVSVGDLFHIPLLVPSKGEHRDGAIGAAAGQDQAEVVRTPADRVYCRRTVKATHTHTQMTRGS